LRDCSGAGLAAGGWSRDGKPKAHALLSSLSSTAAFVNGLLDLILPVLGSLLVLLSRAKTQAVKCAPEDLFCVSRPTADDAAELQELYQRDYVDHHRQMHAGAAGKATCSEWEDRTQPRLPAAAAPTRDLTRCRRRLPPTPSAHFVREGG